jgi:DNA-binding MarR family transcriptional regulator
MARAARKSPAPGKGATASISRPALLERGSDAGFRQLIQDLLGVSVRVQALRDRIGELAGVSGPQYSLMIAAEHLGGRDGVTVSGLAEHLHVSGTFVTAESKRLERQGLIERRPNPADGRSVLLRLTPAGRKRIADITPVLRAINDELFRDTDREGFQHLRRELAAMVGAADDALLIAERHRRGRARAAKS